MGQRSGWGVIVDRRRGGERRQREVEFFESVARAQPTHGGGSLKAPHRRARVREVLGVLRERENES